MPFILDAFQPLRQRGYLTTFANGTLTNAAITVIGTGNSPLEQVKALGYLQAPVVITDEDHWSGFRPDKIDELAARLA